mgnify:CR=1 FL=1
MNKLFNKILKQKKGFYVHAIEVNNIQEIESIIESVIQENEEFSEKEFIEFFESMELYYLGEDPEEEEKVFDFSFESFIKYWI